MKLSKAWIRLFKNKPVNIHSVLVTHFKFTRFGRV